MPLCSTRDNVVPLISVIELREGRKRSKWLSLRRRVVGIERSRFLVLQRGGCEVREVLRALLVWQVWRLVVYGGGGDAESM